MMKYIIGAAVVLAVLMLITFTGVVQSQIEVKENFLGQDVVGWVKMDTKDNVEQIGVDIPLALVESAPEGELPPSLVRIQFPEQVREHSFFDHIDIDYNPAGHPPGPYLVPHFDIHFYGITEQEQLGIDCADTMELGPGVLPDNFILTAPGLPPDGECVPEMGHHGIDLNSPELNPDAPQPFTKTMILGYYAGNMIFMEPMITKAFFLERNSFTLPVTIPDVLPRETSYPTKFYGRYDASNDTIQLIWSEFKQM